MNNEIKERDKDRRERSTYINICPYNKKEERTKVTASAITPFPHPPFTDMTEITMETS